MLGWSGELQVHVFEHMQRSIFPNEIQGSSGMAIYNAFTALHAKKRTATIQTCAVVRRKPRRELSSQ